MMAVVGRLWDRARGEYRRLAGKVQCGLTGHHQAGRADQQGQHQYGYNCNRRS